jgi:hypothetical protein
VEKIEIARLYKKIKRYYPAFDASIEAVEDAYRYLKNVPFDVAEKNVDQHIMTEKFPPTIAEIRAGYQDPESSSVPGVAETRRMLDELDRLKERAVPMPDYVREVLRKIARSTS